MRVITLEEHFLHPKLRELYPASYVQSLDMLGRRLTDVGLDRIQRMDAAGIDLQVLSHVQPGVQTLDRDSAVRLAREVNDWLGDVVARYPTRFAGFAMLPMQDPEEAARELQRTVSQIGFKGALINGHTDGKYLDDRAFSPLLKMAQDLNVPLYLHPTDAPTAVFETYYGGYPALGMSWGWQVETGTHLLRMMSGGVFDRYPDLKVIIGHMGELIPFCLDRINRSVTLGNWIFAARGSEDGAESIGVMQESIAYYMKNNVFITTSGVFDQGVLALTIAKFGIERVLFSVDDPFSDNFEGVDFIRNAKLSADDLDKFTHGNAERVLNLTPHPKSAASFKPSFLPNLGRIKSKIARLVLSWMVK